mmetsp:Transcript_38601/g.75940  ORF Transcript_38601/g.75940 Transcript_38601/m.75940 type:complete len:231 (-) Transcript_38601:2893-3585(-)
MQVEVVAKGQTRRDDLPVRECDIFVVHEDLETSFPQITFLELVDHGTLFGKPHSFSPVETCGVVHNPAAIYNADGLIFANQDLVGAQVSVRPSYLGFGHFFLFQTHLLQSPQDVAVDAAGGHPISVVRDATHRIGFAGGERAPVRVALRFCVLSCNLHLVSGALVRPKEQDLGHSVVVYDLGVGSQQIEQTRYVLTKRNESVLLAFTVQQNCAFRTKFGDILVLLVLSVS